ncbi:2'-5' RNA ligase family protein [Streptomyces sp. NPDC006704]|uniref:2'-5' RNA ligase family protein n=1 Tax=Streptomyces sp. NPDC006704 TaxID=3364760 RepID=UPI0036C45F8C
MKSFEPRFADHPWKNGESVLQVFAVPELSVDRPLSVLIEACRTAMKPFPIRPLSDEMLHVTLEMVTDLPADQISPAERAELITSLENHLAGISAFRFLAGSPVANKAGAYLDCWPDDDLNTLHHAVRSAVRAVRGPQAVCYCGGRPHCSLGYSWADGDSDALQSVLRAISPSHAPFTVVGVVLAEVTFTHTEIASTPEDTQSAWDFSFTPLHTIALTGSGQPVPHL